MTSQMTRFLSMLFKDLLLFSENAAQRPSYADFWRPYRFPGTRRATLAAYVRSLCRSHVSSVGELRRTLRPGRPSTRTPRRISRLFGRSPRRQRRARRRAPGRRLLSPTDWAARRKERHRLCDLRELPAALRRENRL